MGAKRKTSINTALPVKTGLYALFFAQGAWVIELTDWGRHKTRAEAQAWLTKLTRWYCDNGAVMTGDGDDVGSVTMTRGGRWFTIKVNEVTK